MKEYAGYGVRGRGEELDSCETELHQERLDTVSRVLIESGASRVIDLGCGSGALLARLLASEQFTEVVGLDTSFEALRQADRALANSGLPRDGRLRLVHGSFTNADAALTGFDAAAMVETIEHVPPARLSGVERSVFARWKPTTVVVTTPNREYNSELGLAEDAFRHPEHEFEWCRFKFRRWACGVAARNAYDIECADIGTAHPLLGSPTQVAVFRLKEGRVLPSDRVGRGSATSR